MDDDNTMVSMSGPGEVQQDATGILAQEVPQNSETAAVAQSLQSLTLSSVSSQVPSQEPSIGATGIGSTTMMLNPSGGSIPDLLGTSDETGDPSFNLNVAGGLGAVGSDLLTTPDFVAEFPTDNFGDMIDQLPYGLDFLDQGSEDRFNHDLVEIIGRLKEMPLEERQKCESELVTRLVQNFSTKSGAEFQTYPILKRVAERIEATRSAYPDPAEFGLQDALRAVHMTMARGRQIFFYE
jgi:hypothetical protein